jgi:hypothetical protein
LGLESAGFILLDASDIRLEFGLVAAGDLLYTSNGFGTLARLPIGAAGRVLQVNSGGTAPEWGLLGGHIDFASSYEAANLALSTSFQTSETLSYSPPAGWTTYKAQIEMFVVAAGLTSADALELVVVGDATGTVYSDNAASTNRTLLAYAQESGLSGSTDFLVRTRNATASRGTVYTSGVRVTAVRTS